ncbi:hypothetical protein [Micromonospora avicenniae]|uniref:hypothetical protein n=1 Tax=Micromonospora avicenniae TaxID=1198245 RepID=UPI003434FC2F
MVTSRSLRLRRRGLLGIPALVAAALTAAVARPGAAAAAPTVAPAPAVGAAPKAECLADLLGGA